MEQEAEAAVVRRRWRAWGLVGPGEAPRFEPLTGGVSSDIWRVELAARPGLRQARAGQAAGRGGLARAGRAQRLRGRLDARPPAASCRRRCRALLGQDRAPGVFVMAYLRPAAHRLWKEELRDGRADPAVAAAVGARLAAIHAAHRATTRRSPPRFPTDAHLPRHPARALSAGHGARASRPAPRRCAGSSRRTAATKRALVHGDVSPKNILVGPDGPVFLDAECAWYGDPAFDLAFCLNHLLLKCLWTPRRDAGLPRAASTRWPTAYLGGVDWEPPAALEARAARLLPGLFLARVDGKSPVEYVTAETDKERVRRVAGAPAGAAGRAARRGPRGVGEQLADWRACHERHDDRAVSSAAGSGIARPADGRGRGAAWPAARRPGDRAGRCLDRQRRGASTCATAARRFGGYDVTRRGRGRHGEIAPALAGLDAADQAAVDGAPDRARRHAGQGAARRQRHASRSRWPWRMRPPRRAGLPLWRHLRRREAAHAAAARDPDLRRRRPCRRGGSTSRTSWSSARGAASFAAGARLDGRGLPRRRPAPGRARPLSGVADEGGYWPAFDTNEEALDTLVARDRAGRLRARASEVAIALDVAASQFGRDGRYRLALRRARARHRAA